MPSAAAAPGGLRYSTIASISQVVAKLSMSVAAMLSRPRKANIPTMTWITNAGNTISATALVSAAGSIPHCRTLITTESIATVKNPSGIGEPIGWSTIRVIDRRSGSNLSGSKTMAGSGSARFWPAGSGWLIGILLQAAAPARGGGDRRRRQAWTRVPAGSAEASRSNLRRGRAGPGRPGAVRAQGPPS